MPAFFDQPQLFAASGWPVGRVLRLAIWAVLIVACAVSLELRQADTRYEFDLSPRNMLHNEGAAFQAPVTGDMSWPWRHASDTMSDPRQSRLVLFEDGRPLGPPHQAHADIRSLGNGRYSHWNDYVLFSASDNSDPRTNNRRYHAVDDASLSPVVAVLPWIFLLIWGIAEGNNIGAFAKRSPLVRRLSFGYSILKRHIGALGIFLVSAAPIVLCVNLIVIRHWPLPAIITSDTASYTGLNEVRTIGYPVLLKAVAGLFGDLEPLVAIQLNLLLGAIAMLGWAVARLLGNLLCGIALLLLLALDPALLTWTEQLMTEGLFIPLLLAHAALVLLLLTGPSRTVAAFAGMTLVAAILVRPAAYSLLLNLPLLVLLLRRQAAILMWTIIPAAVLYLAAAGVHKAALGTWQSQSFGGYTLLGKVALLIRGDVPGAPPLGEDIYQRIAPQVHEAQTKKFPTEYWVYTANWYDQILYREVAPLLFDYVKRTDPASSASYDRVWREMNSLAWSLALAVIEQDPLGYLRLVVAQYYGLWSITLTATSLPLGEYYVDMADRNLEQLAKNSDLRSWAKQAGLGEETFRSARAAYLESSAGYHRLDELLQTTIPFFRLVLVGTAAGVVFVFCPFWLWRLLTGRAIRAPSAALLYLGVALNGYYILVASVEFALPRYVQAFEGITLTIDLVAYWLILAHCRTIAPVVSAECRTLWGRIRTGIVSFRTGRGPAG